MIIDHELGYYRVSPFPVIPLGAPGEWDDYFVYSMAVIKVCGVYHLFYSGTRNVGANPRIEGSIGLATSTDGVTWTKQGKVIDKNSVPDLGLSPFSILEIDGVYYLFCGIFNNTGTTYRSCYLTSTDLLNWGDFHYLTGLDASAHSPFVIADPFDPDKLILYYSSMMGPAYIKRATAFKSDPATWSGNAMAVDFVSIYPCVRWTGDRFECFFSKPTPYGFMTYRSTNLDGVTILDSNDGLVMPSAPGAWDASFVTTPYAIDDMVFYSGRSMEKSGVGYEGVGCAKLAPVGGVIGWDWTVAGVGPWTIAHSGTKGMRLVAGAQGRPAAYAWGKGRDKSYDIWIYDDLTTNANFQNTFRLIDTSNSGPSLGIWCGCSAGRYVYRQKGAAWVVTSVVRSAGWHKLTFEVGDDVTLKIDDVAVGTDTVFDTDAEFNVGVFGFDYGTGYVDDFSVSDLCPPG